MTSFLKLSFVSLVLVFALAGSAFAQAPKVNIPKPESGMVQSDYAKDVQ